MFLDADDEFISDIASISYSKLIEADVEMLYFSSYYSYSRDTKQYKLFTEPLK